MRETPGRKAGHAVLGLNNDNVVPGFPDSMGATMDQQHLQAAHCGVVRDGKGARLYRVSHEYVRQVKISLSLLWETPIRRPTA